MKAVHFGGGNIGRGFVGLILHRAGYEVVFADVAAALIAQLASTAAYRVHEVGPGGTTWTVDNYRALDSAAQEAELIEEIATAQVVTTAVGAGILKFVAPAIARGLAARPAGAAPLVVMACENAINATTILADAVRAIDAEAASRAIFANTAVDRIVPGQPDGAGLDVTVEAFFEWTIESGPFDGNPPPIADAHFVDDLAPYIERKLFTVNTGHATAAYHGFLAGAGSIAEALATPAVHTEVLAVLKETKTLLIARHGFAPEVQQTYLDRILERFANPGLDDTPQRVGREPLRKLSRNERFISPAAALAEDGLPVDALLRTVAAALSFDIADDAQSQQLQQLLRTGQPAAIAETVTGLEPGHPLFERLVEVVVEHGR